VSEMHALHLKVNPSVQVATDKCIMALLFLIVMGVVAVIVVKVCDACLSSLFVS
jgi:hypothetical protein